MESRFDSTCRGCGEHIYAGDEIYRDDDLGAWVCEYCNPMDKPGFAGFGKQSRAGHTGVRKTLADRLKEEGATRGELPVAGSTRLVEPPAAVARVRMLGRVVAGRPEEAREVDDGEIAVPAAWVGRGSYFALTVDGESMRDAAILDGDTVVVREQKTAKDGQIVVATVAGETTVKRLSIGAHGIRLVAENPRFAPIEVQDGEVTIHGVVVAVMRSLAEQVNAVARQSRASRQERQSERIRHG